MTVQQTIEEALSTVLQQDISVVGAGRTDTGVHARKMVAHFDYCEAEIEEKNAVVNSLNKMLSHDIAIDKIVPVRYDAHARFSATKRTYIYSLTERKDPFNYEIVCRKSLAKMNFDRMNEACRILFEYIDFTSFGKFSPDVKTNNCRITEAHWKQDGDIWRFTISANRFLRNMVRAIVGTLIDVGRGKISLDDFKSIIEAKDRCKAGDSAPACGLALVEIDYPDEIFLEKVGK
jgi:tRNA pseudouridine38-40 synthase